MNPETSTDPVSDADLLSVQEAAARLKVSARTIHRLIQADQIPMVQCGSKWLIPASALPSTFVLDGEEA